MTQDVITKFNSILPANLTPFASVQDFQAKLIATKTVGPQDPSVVFVMKYVTVGPAFITWLAENKYRLDPAFRCFN